MIVRCSGMINRGAVRRVSPPFALRGWMVSVTLNDNNRVNELFILYCSFSHLIEPPMYYRLEHISDVMHHPHSE